MTNVRNLMLDMASRLAVIYFVAGLLGVALGQTSQPSNQFQPAESLMVGPYYITIPQGSTVQQLPNGFIELRYALSGVDITAQVALLDQLTEAPAQRQIASIMQKWNPESPMEPFGTTGNFGLPFALPAEYGDAVQYVYRQRLDETNEVIGIFTLFVGQGGQGLAIDTFVPSEFFETEEGAETLDDYFNTMTGILRQP